MYLPQYDGLAVVDITEPSRPKRIGEFLDADGRPLSEPCIDLSDSCAFVAAAPRGKVPSRLLTYDISQPSKPRLLGTIEMKDGKGFRVLLAGGMLYLVGFTGGRIIAADVVDPAHPRITADLKGADRRGWQYFACDVLVEGGRLYLGDYGGPEIYDLSDPPRPRRLARYRSSYAWQIGAVRGKLLYVPKLDGLEILELPEP